MKRKTFTLPMLLLTAVTLIFSSCSDDAITGCTDPLSANYNPDATEDDGSCTYNTVTLTCATITADRTLTRTGGTPDYMVPCEIVIEANVVVEPGVDIWFAADAGFWIGGSGSLSAVGNDTMPIVFRGTVDQPGSWKGLFFNSNNVLNELGYAVVSGGGSNSFDGNTSKTANIRVPSNKKLKIYNTTVEKSASDGLLADGLQSEILSPVSSFYGNIFKNNQGYPLNVVAPVIGKLDSTGSTYTGNTYQFIKIPGGRPTGNVDWHACTIPYLITETVYVGDGGTAGNLTIHAGTTVKFGADAGISNEEYGNGYIKLTGTASSPVTLTGEQAQPGAWKGIAFQTNNVGNSIDHAVISYGGSSSYTGNTSQLGNIIAGGYSSGTVNVTNSTISNGAACGIYKTPASTLTQTGNTFTGNSGNDVCP